MTSLPLHTDTRSTDALAILRQQTFHSEYNAMLAATKAGFTTATIEERVWPNTQLTMGYKITDAR